ncbi:MAG: zinc-dependent metalloprotease [Planctomycetota bacterium]
MRYSMRLVAAACLSAAFVGSSAGLTSSEPPVDIPPAPAADPVMPPGMAGMPMPGGSSPKAFPSFDTVAKNYTRVVSSRDGAASFYTVWKREKDAQILLELPRNFEKQKLFVAFTVAGGTETAGVQTGDIYAYWKRFDKRLALIEPNYAVRSTGDLESRKGHERVFTDRVILDVPIATMGPGGGPVIDGDALFVGRAGQFFGPMTMGANPMLARIVKAKAFPRNIELAFEMPMQGGRLGTLHYSISELPSARGYKPRAADARVGYFTTTYRDIGHPDRDTPYVRYINRWDLQKRDPKLSMSPPKEPIVFYLEHTIPVRYRRWVRDGVLEWNKAFEEIGFVDAIEVYQQDAATGVHMDKDPEDARYNFILWTNANMGFAIGPSRVHPETGEILDADVVMDEGFISGWVRTYEDLVSERAMQHLDAHTRTWLASRPQWDPRLRLAPPAERQGMRERMAMERLARFGMPFGDHEAAQADASLLGDNRFDGLAGRLSQVNGACECARHAGFELALMRMSHDVLCDLSRPAPSSEKKDVLADPVSGTWEGEVEVPGQVIPFVMELMMMPDKSVRGSLNAMMFSGEMEGMYAEGSRQLTMDMMIPDGPVVEIEFTVGDNEMEGSGTADGETIPLRARRTGGAAEDSEGDVVAGDGSDPDADYSAMASTDDDEYGDESGDNEGDADDASPEPAPQIDDLLDGVPEEFIGPLLKSVVMHEVGHTIGLRHNFKASTVYSLEEMNNAAHEGKAITGSVMDYIPVNINHEVGETQGAYAMTTIGPYDYWAVQYGYTTERNLDPILERVSDPELAFGTDEDSWGSDPRIVVFDLGADPLDYADMQMKMVQELRTEILDRIVEDGENWARARDAYELLLGRHVSAVSQAANWIGGSETYRDLKGDPGDRPSVVPIDTAQQRRAFEFVMANAFEDEAFGLTPELLSRMTVEKWWDGDNFQSLFADPAWPLHERILGIQASAMTMMLNPTTLARVYDNEFRIDVDEDALTLPEIINEVSDNVWRELDTAPKRKHTARKPFVSSLRRNLQREHLDRMIDLCLPNESFGVAAKPISNLSVYRLREIQKQIDAMIEKHDRRLDPYTIAHLAEASVQITKALDAQYIYNTEDMNSGGGGIPLLFFGQDRGQTDR